MLSSVEIVMHALWYFWFGLFFLLNVLGLLVCECLSVCLYSMFVALSPDPQSHDYSAHRTIADLPNVQRQNTDVYFSCYETCHL